jgi:3-oxoacyl-[acyl-carrier protein] reductase
VAAELALAEDPPPVDVDLEHAPRARHEDELVHRASFVGFQDLSRQTDGAGPVASARAVLDPQPHARSVAAMDLGLRGWGVLVTGASGGIGGATGRAFAAEGARVGVHYHRNAEAAEALAAEIGGVALRADLTDEADADALVPAAVEALGRLDACVANAGVWPRQDTAVADLPLDRWRATVDANLTATFLTARAYLRHARAAGAGSLVLVASTAGLFGEAGHADYAAAKAAIAHGLLRSLKNEVVRDVPLARVNAVAPGWTVSPMTDRDLDPATVGRVTATMSLRKVATADEVAAAITWLASPAASHVTGEVLTVAGGMEGRLLWDPHR